MEKLRRFLKIIDQGTVLARDKSVSQVVLNLFKNSGIGKSLTSGDDKYSRDSLKYINNLLLIVIAKTSYLTMAIYTKLFKFPCAKNCLAR